MNVQVWEYTRYDYGAAMFGVNYFLVKDPELLTEIKQKSITIGDWVFEPGEKYNKFGYRNNSSALFTTVDIQNGESVMFHGYITSAEHDNNIYLLFRKIEADGNVVAGEMKGYVDVFFCWGVVDETELCYLTSANAPRCIQMIKPKPKAKNESNKKK